MPEEDIVKSGRLDDQMTQENLDVQVKNRGTGDRQVREKQTGRRRHTNQGAFQFFKFNIQLCHRHYFTSLHYKHQS